MNWTYNVPDTAAPFQAPAPPVPLAPIPTYVSPESVTSPTAGYTTSPVSIGQVGGGTTSSDIANSAVNNQKRRKGSAQQLTVLGSSSPMGGGSGKGLLGE